MVTANILSYVSNHFPKIYMLQLHNCTDGSVFMSHICHLLSKYYIINLFTWEMRDNCNMYRVSAQNVPCHRQLTVNVVKCYTFYTIGPVTWR